MSGLLRFLFFLVLLLLVCQFSLLGVATGDDAATEAALRRLQKAVSEHDVNGVMHVLLDKLLQRDVIYRRPSPLYWVADESTDSESLARIALLFLDYFKESNYDYGRYHPLTRAVHRHLTRVVKTLISWPGTIKEVHSNFLECEDIDSVPDSLRIVITPESPQCFRELHNVVEFEQSELVAAARLHKQKERQAKSVEEEVVDWSNPFLSPPPGQKPPREQLVMNPQAFTDLLEALMYYFLGEWTPAYTIAFCIIVFSFWCLTCGVFLAAAQREQQ